MGGGGEPGQNPSRLSSIDARNAWSVLFGHPIPPPNRGEQTGEREAESVGLLWVTRLPH
jgi:hypothetical protein